MAEKTAGLYVRMNPEKKEKAEAILKIFLLISLLKTGKFLQPRVCSYTFIISA